MNTLDDVNKDWEKEIGDLGAGCAFDANGPLDDDGVKELIAFVKALLTQELIRFAEDVKVGIHKLRYENKNSLADSDDYRNALTQVTELIDKKIQK